MGRTPLIGAKMELSFTRSLALEVDALYRPIRSESSFDLTLPDGRTTRITSRRSHTKWEFPILAKYRIARRGVTPFVTGGILLLPVASGVNLGHTGFVTGGGIEIRSGPLILSPGIRYKRLFPRSGRTTNIALHHVDFTVGIHPATSFHKNPIVVFNRRLHAGVLAGFVPGPDLRIPNPSLFGPSISERNSPIFGAVLELEATRQWSVEANGIYRALHATDISQREGRDVRWAVLTWEFPVLVKYRFLPDRRLCPFVALGPAFRLDGNFNGPRPAHYGVTAGLGVEYTAGPVRLSPAVRYTRWAQERGGRSPFTASTFVNQAQVLATFTF